MRPPSMQVGVRGINMSAPMKKTTPSEKSPFSCIPGTYERSVQMYSAMSVPDAKPATMGNSVTTGARSNGSSDVQRGCVRRERPDASRVEPPTARQSSMVVSVLKARACVRGLNVGRVGISNERLMLTLPDQLGDEAVAITSGRVSERSGAAETSNELSPVIAPDGLFARGLPSACSGTSEISITSRVGAEYGTA